jgi:hypothetical protein
MLRARELIELAAQVATSLIAGREPFFQIQRKAESRGVIHRAAPRTFGIVKPPVSVTRSRFPLSENPASDEVVASMWIQNTGDCEIEQRLVHLHSQKR